MEQKIVSLKVAKAIKEAGYPQDIQRELYGYSLNSFGYFDEPYDYEEQYNYHRTHPGEIIFFNSMCRFEEGCEYCVAPTYFDVLLWLWREKHIKINYDNSIITIDFIDNSTELQDLIVDPEEAIIAAINYLVDNNLFI